MGSLVWFRLWLSSQLAIPAYSFLVKDASTFVSLRSLPLTQDWQKARTCGSSICMSLTPVGPFCPFHSAASIAVAPRAQKLNAATPEFAIEMARIQRDMQYGSQPDPERLMRVAKGMNEAVGEWENLITRLRISQDFQTREYAKLTEAHLDSHGTSTESIASMMRWQSGCMMALAKNLPPPMPPTDVDFMKLTQQSSQGSSEPARQPPSMTAMTSAGKIDRNPFTGDEPAFEVPAVREEYEALCRDHSSLIEFGGTYDTFDPLGKLSFVDEIEKIEERWDVFYARFKLLGQLDKEFSRQCIQFLESMGLGEGEYKELLKKAHQIMRSDAERERDRLVTNQ